MNPDQRRQAWVMLALALAIGVAKAQGAGLADDKNNRIRVQLSPRSAVTLSSEIPARIATLPLREGASFRPGQQLIGFDCSLLQTQLRKAEATAAAAQAVVSSTQRMVELNSSGRLELQQAQAKLDEAQAEAAGAHVLVDRCTIAAPFAGRVVKRQAAPHQYVTPGTPLLDIVQTDQLELQMLVPSRWLAWLKPGTKLTVDVEELGRSYPAKVQRIGAQIDAVSQTVGDYAAMDGDPPGLLPGMSGWAVFPQGR
jgi:RND family efflux transporter MFP subunit